MIILQDRELEGNSKNWKNWMSKLALTTCAQCANTHGTIYAFDIDESKFVPAHFRGQCKVVPMRTKEVGTATDDGVLGADVYLMYKQELPESYITKSEAKSLGWISNQGNLDSVAPNKIIFGGIYHNYNGKLPTAEARIWYEADINYNGGFRGHDRILFSNDGLFFVSYDHYKTYYEIIR